MSLKPVIKVSDIMKKFSISKNTAISFMKNEELNSYYLGAPLYCARENFDSYINYLNDIGWKTYGGGIRTKRAELKDTLAPVIKTKDVMNVFDVCRGTAIKIMGRKQLCSYKPTSNLLVCEKQYFDCFIDELIFCGGIRGLDTMTQYMTVNYNAFNPSLIFLEDVCTDEELERIMRNGIKNLNFQKLEKNQANKSRY